MFDETEWKQIKVGIQKVVLLSAALNRDGLLHCDNEKEIIWFATCRTVFCGLMWNKPMQTTVYYYVKH